MQEDEEILLSYNHAMSEPISDDHIRRLILSNFLSNLKLHKIQINQRSDDIDELKSVIYEVK